MVPSFSQTILPNVMAEETGRIVQVLRDGFRLIDTALICMEGDPLKRIYTLTK